MERENKKILLAVGGVTILLGFLGWFSFFWQIGSIGNKFEEIQRVKLESFVWQEKLNQVSMLKRELPQIEEQSGEIEKMFVGKDDAVPLLQSLERAAVLAGTTVRIESVDLTKLKIGKAKAAPKKIEENESTKSAKKTDEELIQEKVQQNKEKDTSARWKNMLGLTIEIRGDYLALVDFLRRMEGSPYFVQIVIMDIVPAAEAGETGEPQSGVVGQSGSLENKSSSQKENKLKMNLTVAVYANETK